MIEYREEPLSSSTVEQKRNERTRRVPSNKIHRTSNAEAWCRVSERLSSNISGTMGGICFARIFQACRSIQSNVSGKLRGFVVVVISRLLADNKKAGFCRKREQNGRTKILQSLAARRIVAILADGREKPFLLHASPYILSSDWERVNLHSPQISDTWLRAFKASTYSLSRYESPGTQGRLADPIVSIFVAFCHNQTSNAGNATFVSSYMRS